MQEIINQIKQQPKIEIKKQGDYRILKVKDHYFLFQIKKIATGMLMDFGGGGEKLEPLLLLENYVNLQQADSFLGWDLTKNLDENIISPKLDHLDLDFVDQGNSSEIIPLKLWSSQLPIVDFMLGMHYDPLHEKIIEKIAELFPQPAETKILDLGCTKGKLLTELKEKFPKTEPFGLDLNPECVTFCKGEGLNAQQGDAANINNLFPQQFNLIIACGMLTEMVVDREKAMEIAKSMYDSLKAGGYALIAGYRSILLNKADFQQLGFTVLQTCFPENLFNDQMPKEFYVVQK